METKIAVSFKPGEKSSRDLTILMEDGWRYTVALHFCGYHLAKWRAICGVEFKCFDLDALNANVSAQDSLPVFFLFKI